MLILISLVAVGHFLSAISGCVISSNKISTDIIHRSSFFNRPWYHGDQIYRLLYPCQVTVGLLSLDSTKNGILCKEFSCFTSPSTVS